MILVCFERWMNTSETRAGHGSTEDSEIIAALVPSFSSSNEQVITDDLLVHQCGDVVD